MLGQWNSLVRRARMGRERKIASLMVSSYANSDGRGIRLSVARYAVDLEVSYSTARRYLTWLRKVGLLELTRAGSRRKGTASEYRLILGEDVMEHLNVLSPSRQKELADEMREANRTGVRVRAAKAKVPVQRSSTVSAETAPEEAPGDPLLRPPERAQKSEFSAQMAHVQRSPQMTYTPSRTHLSVEDHPSRDERDVAATVTTPGADGPATKPESPPRPQRCDHGLPGGLRADGKPACALCRIAATRPGTRPPPPGERLAPVIQLDPRRTA